MIKVGVFGATGYMGGEALRILLEHPQIEIAWATSRNDNPIEYYHRNLFESGIKLIKPGNITPCDAVFIALPSGKAMEIAKKLLESNTKIIDTEKIVIDGLSGTAGAGADPEVPIHHPEIGNNLVSYNVVDHRHTYEIEQELGNLTKKIVTVHFTTTYVPITRGILAICHCFPIHKVNRIDLLGLYRDFYRNEKFIKIIDIPKDPNATWQYLPYPWVSSVSGTNFCHIGLDYDEKRNRIVVFSVLDSIGKGGAHVAVQNLNLMFGLEEDMGLKRYGLHPY